jgi:type II secretory pathway pseudopilin PulG
VRRDSRSGFALLEALVALTIVTTVGVSVVVLGQQGVRAERVAASEEHLYADADRLLTAISLLRRSELDQRIGGHEVGAYLVTIQQPEPALYRLSLARTTAPDRELLVTVVYRPSEVANQ